MRKRHRSSRKNRSSRVSLNLASMIDVTFLLLMYFMVTTIFVDPEDKLSPTLQAMSEESAGRRSDFQPQIVDVIALDGTPSYRIGDRITSDRAALLDVLVALPKSAGVFIKVHRGVPVGFATTALQVARDAGFDKVTYVPAE
ncbi:MAG: ExbD/TolR family protein [Planctomycetota bacterium]|jgi:biopolymer transport protein ExbD